MYKVHQPWQILVISGGFPTLFGLLLIIIPFIGLPLLFLGLALIGAGLYFKVGGKEVYVCKNCGKGYKEKEYKELIAKLT